MASVGGLNILPKKRWHVRTKENIARVKKDEALAAEEERKIEERARLAEQEARTNILRQKAKHRRGDTSISETPDEPIASTSSAKSSDVNLTTNGHFNLFADVERQYRTFGDNPEHVAEKKQEREKLEKSIGLLTYLGQDSYQARGEVPWYEQIPDGRKKPPNEEDKPKISAYADADKISGPSANFVKPFASTLSKGSLSGHLIKQGRFSKPEKPSSGVKKTKERSSDFRRNVRKRRLSDSDSSSSSNKGAKKSRETKLKRRKQQSSSSSSDSESSDDGKAKLERMRAERIEREKAERLRAQRLLSGTKEEVPAIEKPPVVKQMYNSQFNPSLCRQNRTDNDYRKKQF